MGETKMTNNLVSTNQFCATLDYPVVIRTEVPVSKKSTVVQRNDEAVISVNPVFHRANCKEVIIAEDFFDIISASTSTENSRKKRATMQRFLSMCPDTTLKNLNDSYVLEDLLAIKDCVDEVIVHFLGNSGTPVKTKRTTVQNIISMLTKLQLKIALRRPSPKKEDTSKPRRKEKVMKKGVHPSGGTRRYLRFENTR